MQLTSPAFKHMEMIPAKYTCQGESVSPPLHIEDIPKGCKSIALIMDDPDAINRTFDHWIVWNIQPMSDIAEAAQFDGVSYGINTSGEQAYLGPCPPTGTHRYFFKIYALDTILTLANGANKQELKDAMNLHILDSSEIVGLYQKS